MGFEIVFLTLDTVMHYCVWGGGGNLSLNGKQLSHDDSNTKMTSSQKRQLLFKKLNMPKDPITVAEGRVRAR